jgi:hypothetical protein
VSEVAGRTTRFPHLLAPSAKVAALDDASRVEYITSDHWIGYTRAKEGIARLERLYSWPRKVRMPCLLIVGETNQGKTMILERFLSVHLRGSGGVAEKIPIAYMRMPGIPTVSAFLGKLLEELGAPRRPRASAGDMEQVAIDVMKQCGTRMLIIDELHSILPGVRNAKHEFLTLLRAIGNEVRIPIVGAGTFDAYLAIRSDPQLENRFKPFILPKWEEGEESKLLIRSFCEILPLRRASQLDGDQMTRYLLERSNGNLGELTGLLGAAAELAIATGEERINQSVLAATDYDGPVTRRDSLAEIAR